MSISPRKMISLLLLFVFLFGLSGIAQTAAAAAETRGSCCPADSGEREPAAPCADTGCSCTLCITMEILPLADDARVRVAETLYHLRLPEASPGDFVAAIDYPPETL